MAKRQTDESSDAGASTGGSAARMSVTLTDDGSIAWDRMRASTRDQLRKALSDPRVAEQLGTAGPAVAGSVAASPDAFDPSMTGIVFDTLGNLMMSLARRQGYTIEQAGVLRFTDDEKDALAGPTARVLNKYAGSMGAYQDELTLGVALATCIAGKLTLLRKAATVHQLVPRESEPGREQPGSEPA